MPKTSRKRRTAPVVAVREKKLDHPYGPTGLQKTLSDPIGVPGTDGSAGSSQGSEDLTAFLLDLGRAISNSGSAEDKLSRVAALAAGVVGSGLAAIAYRSSGDASLHWVAAHDGANERAELLGSSLVPGRLIAAALAENVTKVVNEMTGSAERLPSGFPLESQAAAAFPLLAHGVSVGILLVVSPDPGVFTPRRKDMLAGVATLMGPFLEGLRTEQDLESCRLREQQRLEVFQTAAARLALNESPDEALRQFVDAARKLVCAKYGGIVVWDPDGHVRTLVSLGLSEENANTSIGGLRERELLALLHYALVQEGKNAIRVADSTSGHGRSEAPLLRSLLGVPFESKAGNPGAFFLVEKEEGPPKFTADDERLLQLFTSMATVLLDNMQLYEAIERQRLTLDGIQTSMSEGLMVLDANGYVTSGNPAAGSLLHLELAELDRLKLSDAIRSNLSCFATPESAQALADSLDSPAKGQSVFAISLLRPRQRDLNVSIFPIDVSSMEQLTGLLLRDVTDERNVERRRDTFVSVASHELRTPMTTVLGFSELLLQRETTSEQRQTWAKHIYQDSQRVIRIVDDLLNVSRIQSGNMTLNIGATDIANLMRTTADTFAPSSEDHRLIVTAEPGMPKTAADPDKVSQVLTNLISNAIKYSPKGGTVTISGRHEAERQRIVVSVADQGIGIDEGDMDGLFATFRRLHRKETQGIGGTGLGLYIVKGLVELMGGEVWVESKLNEGSTFSFSLPVAGSSLGAAAGDTPDLQGAAFQAPAP